MIVFFFFFRLDDLFQLCDHTQFLHVYLLQTRIFTQSTIRTSQHIHLIRTTQIMAIFQYTDYLADSAELSYGIKKVQYF